MNRIIAGELQELDWDIAAYAAMLPEYQAAVEEAKQVEAKDGSVSEADGT